MPSIIEKAEHENPKHFRNASGHTGNTELKEQK